jgi:hypothetical protein
MVTSISSGADSIANQIADEAAMIEELLKQDKNNDTKETIQQLTALLNEYIIANTKNDSQQTKDISTKISDVIDTFDKNIQTDNNILAQVKSIVNNPNPTQSDLDTLEGILAQLQHGNPTQS